MATYLGTTINESPTITLPAGAKIEAAQEKRSSFLMEPQSWLQPVRMPSA